MDILYMNHFNEIYIFRPIIFKMNQMEPTYFE